MQHDSMSLVRPRVINQHVPTPPTADWKIKTFGQLPDHLKQRAERLPPYLTTRRAAEESGESRSKLYELAAAGEVRAVKSGSSTLWETISILIRLANLPAAQFSAPPVRQATARPTPPPGSRRTRRQPVSASSRKPAPSAVPDVEAPPVQPAAPPSLG
jgi:hypothetical protein